uniref:Uncharacterized protein n=1 Tax=viral metagenome TaxID=1070528 RepID=A0A6C0CWW1_9ZZZZ
MISFILSYIWYSSLKETKKDIELKETMNRIEYTKPQEYITIPHTCDICGQQYYWCICD